MTLRISKRAQADIKEIWIYTFYNWSERQADSYISLIHHEIKALPDNFDKGKSIEEVKEGVKYVSVKSHLIFYHRANDGVVEVLRVLHKMMDFQQRLKR